MPRSFWHLAASFVLARFLLAVYRSLSHFFSTSLVYLNLSLQRPKVILGKSAITRELNSPDSPFVDLSFTRMSHC